MSVRVYHDSAAKRHVRTPARGRPGALERLAARTTLTVRPLERVDDCVLIRVLDLRLVAEKLAVRYPSGIAFVVTSPCSAYGEGLGAREGGSSGTARAESPASRVEGSADSGSDCMRSRPRPWWRRRGWRRVSEGGGALLLPRSY